MKPRLYSQGGSHRLYQADSLDLVPRFAAGQFDMIFADPPYFLSNGGKTVQNGEWASVNKGKWDVSQGVERDHEFHLAWLRACQRALKPSGTIWVSGTQHSIFSVGFAMQRLGFHLLNTVTWYKPNAAFNKSGRYQTHSTELLIWASPRRLDPLPHIYNYRAMKLVSGGKQLRDVWTLPRPGEEELLADNEGRVWTIPTPPGREKKHGKYPAQKPLALLRRAIMASTQEDAAVLDPFNGSGTTGVASLQLGRRYTGIDKSRPALRLTQKRIDTLESIDPPLALAAAL